MDYHHTFQWSKQMKIIPDESQNDDSYILLISFIQFIWKGKPLQIPSYINIHPSIPSFMLPTSISRWLYHFLLFSTHFPRPSLSIPEMQIPARDSNPTLGIPPFDRKLPRFYGKCALSIHHHHNFFPYYRSFHPKHVYCK